MAIVTVVAVGMLVPAGQPVHIDALGAKADAHVAVPAFGHDSDLEVINTAGGGNGMGGPDRRRVLVRLTVAFVLNPKVIE